MLRCSISVPYTGEVVTSKDGSETLMIQSVINLDYVHYAIYIPLVTQFPLGEYMIIDDEGMKWESDHKDEVGEIEEAIGFGRIRYDYGNLRAYIEPLDLVEDLDIIDRIMSLLERSCL